MGRRAQTQGCLTPKFMLIATKPLYLSCDFELASCKSIVSEGYISSIDLYLNSSVAPLTRDSFQDQHFIYQLHSMLEDNRTITTNSERR